MSKKVCLDAGHYEGYNRYAPFPAYSEGNQMWTLTNKLKAKLEACGVNVVMTKTSLADNPGLQTRGKTAGKNKADLFISLHSNAVSSKVNDDVTGVETYYSIFDDKGYAYANKLNKAVVDVMNTKNRGAKTRKGSGNWDYYGVIKGSVDSGCKHAFLIEHGFHTSTKDASFLIKDENLEKIADAECKVICEILGVSVAEKPTNVKPTEVKPAHKGTAYKLTCKMLKVRKKASTLSAKVGEYHYGETFYVIGWKGNWCQLVSGNWMCAKKYCRKV